LFAYYNPSRQGAKIECNQSWPETNPQRKNKIRSKTNIHSFLCRVMNQKNRVDRTILMDRPIHAIDQNHWTLYTIQLQSSATAGKHR